VATNVSTIGAELIHQMLDTTNNLTVTASIQLHKMQEELAALVARCATAVQLPVEPIVDVDFVGLAAACDALQYTDRAAEVWGWILGGLAGNLEAVCGDELVQGAVAEAWATGTLRLILDPKIKGWSCDFLDGDLIITGNPESVASNVAQIGSDIVDKL
jgi:hypothetical protein